MLEKIKGNVTAYWCVEYTTAGYGPPGLNMLGGKLENISFKRGEFLTIYNLNLNLTTINIEPCISLVLGSV